MRIRTLKPGFWGDERMAALPHSTRLLAIALLNFADDEGYFLANPALVRGALFPFDEDTTNVRRGLEELAQIGFVRLGIDGESRAVGQVVNFLKHQKIDRPNPSRIKGSARFVEDSSNARRGLSMASLSEMEDGSGMGTGVSLPSDAPRCDASASACKKERRVAAEGCSGLPFTSPAFAESWAGFVEFRRSAKKACTPRAEKLLFARLEKWGEEKAIRALDLSTESGWLCVIDPDLREGRAKPSRRVGTSNQDDHAKGF